MLGLLWRLLTVAAGIHWVEEFTKAGGVFSFDDPVVRHYVVIIAYGHRCLRVFVSLEVGVILARWLLVVDNYLRQFPDLGPRRPFVIQR